MNYYVGQEYVNYSHDSTHLTETEAIERFQEAKTKFPSAIVELEPHHCGHWTVEVHRTESEKQNYYRRAIDSLVNNFGRRCPSGEGWLKE